MVKRVLMVGASNGGEMMSAVLEDTYINNGISKPVIDFIDDNKSLWGTRIKDKLVLSLPTSEILDVVNGYDYAFVGIGLHKLIPFKERLYGVLVNNITLINIVHHTASVSMSASIGIGNYIGAFSYIGPFSKIGDCNFFSSNTIIEHHNKIGNLNSWGPSVSTSGMCCIGDRVCMGTGINMIYHLTLGNDCIVASNVSLTGNIKDNKLVRCIDYPGYIVKSWRGWK